MTLTIPDVPYRSGDTDKDIDALYDWCAALRRHIRAAFVSVEPNTDVISDVLVQLDALSGEVSS